MRPRGIVGQVMPDEVCGPLDHYALFSREDGTLLMVHSEGVGYEVTDEKPWRWTDYDPDVKTWTPAELKGLGDAAVDLADWVRTFGARLESNFWQAHRWVTGE